MGDSQLSTGTVRAHVTYDKVADVLYLSYEDAGAMRGTETSDGMVRRFGANGKLVGITVVDFSEWLARAALSQVRP